jgi:hypothetical protein
LPADAAEATGGHLPAVLNTDAFFEPPQLAATSARRRTAVVVAAARIHPG